MKTLVELQRITVRVQDAEVLSQASVCFPAGRSSLIMGPSGCGKSTLLKVAAGVIVPDEGRVLLSGRDMSRLSERREQEFRRRGGFMFQDAALWANKTVYENLALPLQFHHRKMDAAQVRSRVSALLRRMAMEDAASQRPAQLSVGERKAVSFLRAVIMEPAVLFLDEPTPSLDHVLLERMMELIREHRDRGCTILAVTHDAHLASMMADFLVVLKEGRVLEAAEIETIRSSRDPEVMRILSEVLAEAATYDTDILDLLGG